MFASSPAALLLLFFLGTATNARTCPPPGERESQCIELTADGSGEEREVQLSPGLATTFLFDSDVRGDGVTLERRERFEVVEPGKRILTLVPSEKMRGENPGKVTVCFADGAAPACATFRLLVHPAVGERQVEIFRQPRPVESVQTELRKTQEENARLRAENARLRTERDRPEGLIGLFASGMVGMEGIPSQLLTRSITQRETNPLVARLARTFRAPGRVAMELMLENPAGAKPWTPRGAVLVGPKGEILEATFFPAEPIPPGETRRMWLEVMAPDTRTEGPFVLKLWEADGQRTFVLGNVTFP
ncbi:MAG TPA: DUF2381 family protein [Archangium sp.]|uniref:DUF2381 family protein n=1 Tax=Archangium sp. TaxID=1872627 RepID=UPI002ED7A46A